MATDSIFNITAQVLGWFTAAGLSVTLVVGIAWGVFRLLSTSWLKAQFDRHLAIHRRQQDEILEQTRSRFAAHLDRATRLHTAEFEVLPEAWKRLREASAPVKRLVDKTRPYSPVSFVPAEDLESALAAYPLKEIEKTSVRDTENGHERQTLYNSMVDRYRYDAAYEQYLDFHNYLAIRGVLIDPELRHFFFKASDVLLQALHDFYRLEIDFVGDGPKPSWAEAMQRLSNGLLIESRIEKEIDIRLWQGRLVDLPSSGDVKARKDSQDS